MNIEVTESAHPPRIYYLTEEFYPPQIGGVELMVSYLSHGLAARGVPTEVITRQTLPPALPEEIIGSVRVRRIRPAGLMKGIGWRAVPAMLSYYKVVRHDVDGISEVFKSGQIQGINPDIREFSRQLLGASQGFSSNVLVPRIAELEARNTELGAKN